MGGGKLGVALNPWASTQHAVPCTLSSRFLTTRHLSRSPELSFHPKGHPASGQFSSRCPREMTETLMPDPQTPLEAHGPHLCLDRLQMGFPYAHPPHLAHRQERPKIEPKAPRARSRGLAATPILVSQASRRASSPALPLSSLPSESTLRFCPSFEGFFLEKLERVDAGESFIWNTKASIECDTCTGTCSCRHLGQLLPLITPHVTISTPLHSPIRIGIHYIQAPSPCILRIPTASYRPRMGWPISNKTSRLRRGGSRAKSNERTKAGIS
jgi:hypothetical protein